MPPLHALLLPGAGGRAQAGAAQEMPALCSVHATHGGSKKQNPGPHLRSAVGCHLPPDLLPLPTLCYPLSFLLLPSIINT